MLVVRMADVRAVEVRRVVGCIKGKPTSEKAVVEKASLLVVDEVPPTKLVSAVVVGDTGGPGLFPTRMADVDGNDVATGEADVKLDAIG